MSRVIGELVVESCQVAAYPLADGVPDLRQGTQIEPEGDRQRGRSGEV